MRKMLYDLKHVLGKDFEIFEAKKKEKDEEFFLPN